MDAEDVVIESANLAAATVGTAAFFEQSKRLLQLSGSELAALLGGSDEMGLFSHVDIERDGKERLGAVLVTPSRLLLWWTVGTFKARTFTAVISRDEIASVERSSRGLGILSAKPREVLTVQAKESWKLLFYANLFEGGQSIVPMVEKVIDGSITPALQPGTSSS